MRFSTHLCLQVYVYDHCPFCVRVRLALGLKNIKYDCVFMANDDISTPTALVGKKVRRMRRHLDPGSLHHALPPPSPPAQIAPILEMPAEDMVMGESLDICAYFDESDRFGPSILLPATGRKDLKAWQKGLQTTLRCLTRPRYMQTCLPEFMMRDGKDAFVKNHPIPPFEKVTLFPKRAPRVHFAGPVQPSCCGGRRIGPRGCCCSTSTNTKVAVDAATDGLLAFCVFSRSPNGRRVA